MTTTQTTKSVLSKKDQGLPWQNQVTKLRNIANRAFHRCDWMRELIESYERQIEEYSGDEFETHPDKLAEYIADCQKKHDEAFDRGNRATNELLAIAKANNDPRVKGLK